MSTKYLGETFDIHGGGMDLLFPHHESEIAQSKGACGKAPVRYWMHNNMITINGQKMGKSLGNFINLEQFFNGSPVAQPGVFAHDDPLLHASGALPQSARLQQRRTAGGGERIRAPAQREQRHSPSSKPARPPPSDIASVEQGFYAAMSDDLQHRHRALPPLRSGAGSSAPVHAGTETITAADLDIAAPFLPAVPLQPARHA